MTIKHLIAAVVLASFALAAGARQSAAGKWNGSVETPQGPFAFAFSFAVEGGTLTGNMSNELMGAIPISDGTVKGNDVAFKLKIEGAPEGTMTINYTGTVAGDELKLTSKFEGTPPGGGPAEQTITMTRAK
jgi:hypothetical protein